MRRRRVVDVAIHLTSLVLLLLLLLLLWLHGIALTVLTTLHSGHQCLVLQLVVRHPVCSLMAARTQTLLLLLLLLLLILMSLLLLGVLCMTLLLLHLIRTLHLLCLVLTLHSHSLQIVRSILIHASTHTSHVRLHLCLRDGALPTHLWNSKMTVATWCLHSLLLTLYIDILVTMCVCLHLSGLWDLLCSLHICSLLLCCSGHCLLLIWILSRALKLGCLLLLSDHLFPVSFLSRSDL